MIPVLKTFISSVWLYNKSVLIYHYNDRHDIKLYATLVEIASGGPIVININDQTLESGMREGPRISGTTVDGCLDCQISQLYYIVTSMLL